MGDNRREALHSAWEKNRRSRAPAFLPGRWADRKFQWCARRRKRFPRSSSRGSRARDTSCRRAEEVPSLSLAFDLHGEAAVTRAADMNESSFRLLQEPFNNG